MHGLLFWIDKVYKFINIARLIDVRSNTVCYYVFVCCDAIITKYMPYALRLKRMTDIAQLIQKMMHKTENNVKYLTIFQNPVFKL